MLLDYTLTNPAPAADQTVWSHAFLQPVAAGALTPFSASVQTELCRRAWVAYYDRLGFQPAPRAQVVRRYLGRLYFNRSLCAQLDAAQAGLAPVSLRVDGRALPLAAWEKPGLLAGFKHSRTQKRIDALLSELAAQLPALTAKSRAWYVKTRDLRWSQAEILQVMEEIERVGTEAMTVFFAARHNLETHYLRLLAALDSQLDAAQAVLLIADARGDLPGLVESDIAAALVESAARKQDADEAAAFLDAYGHRALHEAELAYPRWVEDPAVVLAARDAPMSHPVQPSAAADQSRLLDALEPPARRSAQTSLEQVRRLPALQSQALHALAYIWAGTRRWALAAAKEAMTDGRLHAPGDIFYFELEEIKEMMTGEWNISARAEIQATATERKAPLADLRAESAPDLLIGDQPAHRAHAGLPAAPGRATGPFHRWGFDGATACPGAIVGAETLDSGWALALPHAAGFVAAGGTPLDPLVAAAAAWQRPVIVGLGPAYAGLVEATTTTVDATLMPPSMPPPRPSASKRTALPARRC